jgi:hypothetical protein
LGENADEATTLIAGGNTGDAAELRRPFPGREACTVPPTHPDTVDYLTPAIRLVLWGG